MALQTQNASVDFSGGLDQGTDDALVLPAKLLKLDNGQFVAKNSIEQRPGWRTLVDGTVYSGDTPGGTNQRSFTRAGSEVVLESSTGAHSADVQANRWKQIAQTSNRCCAELEGIFHGHSSVVESDIAGTEDMYAVAYTRLSELPGGVNLEEVWLRVVSSGVTLRHERIDTSGATPDAHSPRVLFSTISQRFYVYWAEFDGATRRVMGTSFTVTAPTAVLGKTPIGAQPWVSDTNIDACLQPYASGGEAIFLAYAGGTTARSVQLVKLNTSNGVSVLSQVNSGTIGAFALGPESIRVVCTSLIASSRPGYIAVVRSVGSLTTPEAMQHIVADLDNGVPTATFGTAAGGGAPAGSGKISLMRDPNQSTHFWMVWETTASGTCTTTLCAAMYKLTSFAGGGGADNTGGFFFTTVARSVGIATDMFVRGRDVYIGARHYSKTQASVHVLGIGRTEASATAVTQQHDICARITCNGGFQYNSTLGGLARSNWQLWDQVPHVVIGTDSNPYLVIQRGNGDVITTIGIDVTPLGLDRLKLDFQTQLNFIEMDQSTVLAGADPKFWDGETYAELGFEMYPESSEFVITPPVGALAGVVGITILYEWVDRNGIKHQSAPAIPQNVNVGGVAPFTFGFVIPTLRLTRKTDVAIVVYMTDLNGSLYYRLPSNYLAFGFANDPTVDTISGFATVNFTGANRVSAGELLPTTGGVLPPAAFPACKNVETHQTRIVFAGTEDRNQIKYTEERSGAFFPSYNEVYVIEVSLENGRASATRSMDDKLIIGQERQLLTVYGRGPNRLGIQNEFTPPIPTLQGYGQDWDASNVFITDPNGVWFYSTGLGLRQLGRSLQISVDQEGKQLGSQVDDYSNASTDNFKGACKLSKLSQVRFAVSGGVLVYSYEFNQWSRHTSDMASPQDCLVFNGDFTFLDNLSGLFFVRERVGQIFDSSDVAATFQYTIIMTVGTSWIKMQGVQGFQRVRAMSLLGSVLQSAGSRPVDQVVIYELVDYSNIVSTSVNQAIGNGRPLAGDVYQIEHQQVFQKCEAVRYIIEVQSATGGLRLTNMNLELGIKKGHYKNTAANRF